MTRFALSTAAAALAAVLAGPAAAQIAGTYAGTSADGSNLSFVVSTDPSTNVLAVTAAGVSFSAPCKGGTYTLDTSWGYGLTADIVNRKMSNTSDGNYFDITFNLVFSADGQTATGKIETFSPTLYPSDSKPTKALLCYSPKQTLSLTLQPPGAKQPAMGHTAYLYDRHGRIIGTIQR